MVATSSRILAGIGRFTNNYPKLSKTLRVGMIAAVGAAGGAADRAASFNRFDVHPESLGLSIPGAMLAAILTERSMSRRIKLATMEVGNLGSSDRERWMIKDVDVQYGDQKTMQTYAISENYGEGGCATVRLALNLSQGSRPEIIKLAKYVGDKEFTERFVAEAHMLMKFNHPNVVTCYGMGELNGVPFISMEFVAGSSLADYLIKFSRIHPLEATRVMIEVANVFKAVHQAGIVHRDIKPDNILVSRNGVIKVLDFGIAKDTTSEKKMTQAGAVFGTPEYMAPEQHFGGPVDARTDIYALGLLYYNLLTGEPPFPCQTNLATGSSESYGEYIKRNFRAITNSEIPDIASAIPHFKQEGMEEVIYNMREIFKRALASDKERRHFNVDQFVADLKVVEASIVRAGLTPTSWQVGE